MEDIKNLLINYLKSANPAPTLAIKVEPSSALKLDELGFEQQAGYWVISRQQAEIALMRLSGLVYPDLSRQFEYERTQREKLLQEALNKN